MVGRIAPGIPSLLGVDEEVGFSMLIVSIYIHCSNANRIVMQRNAR